MLFDLFGQAFSDKNLMPWLVPFWPLAGFALISLLTLLLQFLQRDFTKPLHTIPATDHNYGGHHPDYDGMDVPYQPFWFRITAIVIGMTAMTLTLFFAWSLVFGALDDFGAGTFGKIPSAEQAVEEEQAAEPEHGATSDCEDCVYQSNIEWMSLGESSETGFRIGTLVDPLTSIMLFMVPIAAGMIFVYSIGYMWHDPRQARFFALICLFAGGMLTLVVADNLMLMFVGWEIMGLCSYSLIGFWYEKESAYNAAVKAFTVTRVADVIMLLGIVYLWSLTGTLNFRDILYNTETLQMLGNTKAILFGSWGLSASGLIGMLVITGTVGKSAQFPLHVWLPDAMEGPTPVSAMIHAAAMVSAGVYAVIRMYPLYVGLSNPHAADPTFSAPLLYMAIAGSFTALFAATMGTAQRDVKAVLAYSTISQLGFMIAALGIGAYIAAAFHLITHAFFKALLFMSSGSVIHAMEHGEHHVHEHHAHAHNRQGHDDHHHDEHGHDEEHFDAQDMFNMGGLRHRIPVTFWTFLIGGLSLSGFPLLTAGFWSKDEILADAWNGTTVHGSGLHMMVFWVLALAAFLTAFYTMRQLGLTFWGDARTEEAEHAGLGGPYSIVSVAMQAPLIVLAFFAIVAGFIGVPPDFPILGSIFSPEHNFFHNLVVYTLPAMANGGAEVFHVEAPPVRFFPVFMSVLVALGGLFVGWLMYWRKPLKAGQADPLIRIVGENVYTTLQRRYYMDDLYDWLFVRPFRWVGINVIKLIDKGFIDGVLHKIAAIFIWIGDFIKTLNAWLIDGVGDGIPKAIFGFGGWMRRTQSGRVQQYLLIVLLAMIAIGILFALSAGALAIG
ncbi:MAG: proton-conducting transporter membrane subunit [Anaerolineae bacterium]|nr:proton-conducting transporter membrane subunit [Anaerolineae bacterium]